MRHQYGGLETAKRLLAIKAVSDGFTALWERLLDYGFDPEA